MNKFFAVILSALISLPAAAQNNNSSDNLLFDDSDIIVRATVSAPNSADNGNYDAKAAAQARDLLKSAPRRLEAPEPVSFKTTPGGRTKKSATTFAAPFGLLWNADIETTRNQDVELTPVDMKDHPNSYEATRLPKKIDFFDKVYISFGEEDELQRILAYSHAIDDNASASQTLQYYKTFSENLNKKYGNMQQFFTPAPIEEKKEGEKEAPKEDNSIGNPQFLSQLAQGTAILYSTYHNNDVSATLSINVDGEQKSFIVIDYSNLQVIKQQEKTTFDAL